MKLRHALILALAIGVTASNAPAQTLSYRMVGKHPMANACFKAAEQTTAYAAGLGVCDTAMKASDLSHGDRLATLVNRGVLKYRLGLFGEAIQDFDAVLAQAPDMPEALIDKGLAIVARGQRPQDALPLFEAGLARRPEASVAYFGRATVHEETRNYAAAYRDYKLASALAPGWRAPKEALSRFSIR